MPEFIGQSKRRGIAWRKSGLNSHRSEEDVDQWDNFLSKNSIRDCDQDKDSRYMSEGATTSTATVDAYSTDKTEIPNLTMSAVLSASTSSRSSADVNKSGRRGRRRHASSPEATLQQQPTLVGSRVMSHVEFPPCCSDNDNALLQEQNETLTSGNDNGNTNGEKVEGVTHKDCGNNTSPLGADEFEHVPPGKNEQEPDVVIANSAGGDTMAHSSDSEPPTTSLPTEQKMCSESAVTYQKEAVNNDVVKNTNQAFELQGEEITTNEDLSRIEPCLKRIRSPSEISGDLGGNERNDIDIMNSNKDANSLSKEHANAVTSEEERLLSTQEAFAVVLQKRGFLDQYLLREEQGLLSSINVRNESRMQAPLGIMYSEGQYWQIVSPTSIEFSVSDTLEANQLCWEAALFNFLNSRQDEIQYPKPIEVQIYQNKAALTMEVGKGLIVLGTIVQVLNVHSTFGLGVIPETVVGWLVLEIIKIVASLHKVGIAHNNLGLESFLVVSNGTEWSLLLTGLGAKGSVLVGTDLKSHFHHDMLSVAFITWSLLMGCAQFHFSNVDGEVHVQAMYCISSNLYLRGRLGWRDLFFSLINSATGSQGIRSVPTTTIDSICSIARMGGERRLNNAVTAFWDSLLVLRSSLSNDGIADEIHLRKTLGVSSEQLILSLHFGQSFPCEWPEDRHDMVNMKTGVESNPEISSPWTVATEPSKMEQMDTASNDKIRKYPIVEPEAACASLNPSATNVNVLDIECNHASDESKIPDPISAASIIKSNASSYSKAASTSTTMSDNVERTMEIVESDEDNDQTKISNATTTNLFSNNSELASTAIIPSEDAAMVVTVESEKDKNQTENPNPKTAVVMISSNVSECPKHSSTASLQSDVEVTKLVFETQDESKNTKPTAISSKVFESTKPSLITTIQSDFQVSTPAIGSNDVVDEFTNANPRHVSFYGTTTIQSDALVTKRGLESNDAKDLSKAEAIDASDESKMTRQPLQDMPSYPGSTNIQANVHVAYAAIESDDTKGTSNILTPTTATNIIPSYNSERPKSSIISSLQSSVEGIKPTIESIDFKGEAGISKPAAATEIMIFDQDVRLTVKTKATSIVSLEGGVPSRDAAAVMGLQQPVKSHSSSRTEIQESVSSTNKIKRESTNSLSTSLSNMTQSNKSNNRSRANDRIVEFIPAKRIRDEDYSPRRSRRSRSRLDQGRSDMNGSRRSHRTVLSCGMKGCKNQFPVSDDYMWAMMVNLERQDVNNHGGRSSSEKDERCRRHVVPTHHPMHLVCLKCVGPKVTTAFWAKDILDDPLDKKQFEDYMYYKASRVEYDKWIRRLHLL